MKKKALSLFLCLLVVLLCACSSARNCTYVLSRLIAVGEEDGGESGIVYTADAEEATVGYLSGETADILYGDGAWERYFSLIEDYAIFISQRAPGEIAVFKCYSRSHTDTVAEMCLMRADVIRIALRASDYAQKAESIRVDVYREFVVLSFTDAQRQVVNELKRIF